MVVREVARRRRSGAPSTSTTTAASPASSARARPGAHAACSPACTCSRRVSSLACRRRASRTRSARPTSPRSSTASASRRIRYGGYWHEHSTPERYLQGNWNLLSGSVTLTQPPAPDPRGRRRAPSSSRAPRSRRSSSSAPARRARGAQPRPRRRLARQHRRRRRSTNAIVTPRRRADYSGSRRASTQVMLSCPPLRLAAWIIRSHAVSRSCSSCRM